MTTWGARSSITLYLRAIRVHQWVKNLLVFIPLLMAHRVQESALLGKACAAFFAFSLCASAVYLINDLADVESDRLHRTKKNRPFASGALSVKVAYVLIPALLGAAALISSVMPRAFVVTLGSYFALTLAYSLRLKRLLVVDIMTLAILYATRVLAGGCAVSIAVSPWLLVFSMFFFLSLACVKRFSELRAIKLANQSESVGRGYRAVDLESIAQCGASSGYLSVLVLALYVSSKEVTVLYSYPQLIWFICPLLLYWITRVWILAHRGVVHDDPIVFAITDPASYATGALAVALVALAT